MIKQAPSIERSDTLWNAWVQAGEQANEFGDELNILSLTQSLTVAEEKRRRSLYQDARDWFNKAFNHTTDLAKDLDVGGGRCLAGSAWARFNLDDASAAEGEARRALQFISKSMLARQRARAQHVIGVICFRASNYSEAHDRLTEAIRLYGTTGNRIDRALLLETLGRLESLCSNFVQAHIHYSESAELFGENSGNELRLLDILSRASRACLEIGRYRVAYRFFERWQKIQQALTGLNPDVFSETSKLEQLLGFAELNLIVGQPSAAIDLLAEAQATANCLREVPDSQSAYAALLNARLENSCNRPVTAFAFVENAKIVGAAEQLKFYRIKGDILFNLGDYDDALNCYSKAEQFISSGIYANLDMRIGVWLGLSGVYTSQTHVDQLLTWSRRAIDYLETNELTTRLEMALALHEFSRGLMLGPSNDEALPICQRAIDLLSISGFPQHPQLSSFQLTLAEIYWSRGEVELSMRALDRSRDFARNHQCCARIWSARCELITGQLFQVCKNHNAAMQSCNRALNLWKLQAIETHRQHPESIWTMMALALTHASLKLDLEANQIFDSAIALAGKLNRSKSELGYVLNRWGNYYFEQTLYREAYWLYSKSLSLYSSSLGMNHSHTQTISKNCQRALQKLSEHD